MSLRQPDRIDGDVVCVSVLVAAAPETVWSFLADGRRFAAWIGAFAGQPPLPGTRIDPRVGGAVRVCYPGEQAALGKITGFEPPRRIEFTWGYEQNLHGIAPGSTTVEIVLTAVADGTLVELRHRGLPTPERRGEHSSGWKHYLSMLARLAAEGQHASGLAALLDAYFRAWAASDRAERKALLEACCEAEVSVRSGFACTDGLDELNDHIANAQRHMPGLTLAASGPAQQLHGYARIDWQVRAPNGQPVMAGTNFARLSPRGRILELVGFGAPPPA